MRAAEAAVAEEAHDTDHATASAHDASDHEQESSSHAPPPAVAEPHFMKRVTSSAAKHHSNSNISELEERLWVLLEVIVHGDLTALLRSAAAVSRYLSLHCLYLFNVSFICAIIPAFLYIYFMCHRVLNRLEQTCTR